MESNYIMRKLNIHGDNIVECERAFALCIRSLGLINVQIDYNSAPCCPCYKANDNEDEYSFTFYPGYGRWNIDILKVIQSSEGSLREAPDVLITEIIDDKEEPILSIEYCGALPAGNQAWQRSGRGYSIGKSNIPYLYVAELGGYELDSDRNRKAARLPNPAIPFSYLSYSKEHSPVLQIYEKSPGCDDESYEKYRNVFADDLLVEITRKVIKGLDYTQEKIEVENKLFEFIKIKANESNGTVTLSAAQWDRAYNQINNGQLLVDYLVSNCRINWQKTSTIPVTSSAEAFMNLASSKGIGLTSSKLPLCIIPSDKKQSFCERMFQLYPNLTTEFKRWIQTEKDLVIVWITGFKPRGDDSRPDRGLAPLARMLAGTNTKILSFVYGPALPITWQRLEQNPIQLGTTNGLWEAIFSASDAVLVDSKTSTLQKNCFLKSEFIEPVVAEEVQAYQTSHVVHNTPTKIGENDVDTVIHILFTNLTSIKIFEGLCNPPGGDWSGISILVPEAHKEYRWLSLPRVSATQAKRPDHVFLLFPNEQSPIILSIESKEKASAMETNIGPRLNRFLTDLFETELTAVRSGPDSEWHYASHYLSTANYQFASASAYIMKRESDLDDVLQKVNTDLILSFIFDDNGDCCIRVTATTEMGEFLKFILRSSDIPESRLRLQF